MKTSYCVVLFTLTLLLSSCCTCRPHPAPMSALIPYNPPPATGKTFSRTEIENTPIKSSAMPIIDMHTHNFNALYLPILNIAQGRSREMPFGAVLSPTVATILALGIIGETERNQHSSNSQPNVVRRRAPFGITAADVQKAAAGLRQLSVPLLSEPSPYNSGRIQKILEDPNNWKIFAKEVFAVEYDPTDTRSLANNQFITFLSILMSKDENVRKTLNNAFEDKVELFVYHPMDMGPTYGESPDGIFFWKFETQQMARYAEMDATGPLHDKFLRFVAFNPFNEEVLNRANFKPENSRSLQIVKEALQRGAWGVKYYPPAGYRPSDNSIPGRPWFSAILQSQWDSRYLGFTNESLDALNLAFFRYCAENKIPVFAHCSYGEFQGACCYGELMPNPAYYRKILDTLQHENLDLILCLGHSGGADFWFDVPGSEHRSWGEQVYELCTNYPNVYCEVGILTEAIDDNNAATFATKLFALFQVPNQKYAFKDKIMYGTDWFMPEAAASSAQMLNAYQKIFSTPKLSTYYNGFFCLNALDYLGIDRDRSISTEQGAIWANLSRIRDLAKAAAAKESAP